MGSDNKGRFFEISKLSSISAESILIHSKKDNLKITSVKSVSIDAKEAGIIHKTIEKKAIKIDDSVRPDIYNYETDGHYSTVYLVCLMLGMGEGLAKELAIAAEKPDTTITGETDFEIDQTWAYPKDQAEKHSLTGGFHGSEEFLTALKFIYLGVVKTKDDSTDTIHNNTIIKLGELLHRFGDTYAHAKFDNLKPADLVSYNLHDNLQNVTIAIASWKGKGGEKLSVKIEPWITYINYYTKKYGYDFLTNEQYQREAFKGKTLQEELKEIYLVNPTDKFIMYGGDKIPIISFTTDHFITDKGYPDMIFIRPDWYLSYVKNLTWMISVRFKLDLNKFDVSVFERMVTFAKKRQCSMKGIIDFEISKRRGKCETYIPVFYSKITRPIASVDAIFNTDYFKNAQAVTENTKLYIEENNGIILNKGLEAHHGNVKINKSGFYDEDYFIIKYLITYKVAPYKIGR